MGLGIFWSGPYAQVIMYKPLMRLKIWLNNYKLRIALKAVIRHALALHRHNKSTDPHFSIDGYNTT